MPILEVKDVNVIYKVKDKAVKACKNVNLEIDEQDSIGIVGESGSGKSTLAMAILRLLPKRITEVTGEVKFNGEDIIKMTPERLAEVRWTQISVVFQKSMNSLSPVHKIGKQLEGIYRVHRPNASSEECKKVILKLFEMVNLAPRVYNLYAHELSGGMMQRVSIALSLIFNPRLLVLDEATTALDVVTESQILREIIKLEETMKLTRFMITHDVSVVASTCKKIAVMYAGCMLESGYVKDVLINPKHPYTQGLLRSFPSFKGERGSLRGIPGSLPDLAKEIQGCPFAPRCSERTENCLTSMPTTKRVGNKWTCACHLVGGEDIG